jgi:hypothetical protein
MFVSCDLSGMYVVVFLMAAIKVLVRHYLKGQGLQSFVFLFMLQPNSGFLLKLCSDKQYDLDVR